VTVCSSHSALAGVLLRAVEMVINTALGALEVWEGLYFQLVHLSDLIALFTIAPIFLKIG